MVVRARGLAEMHANVPVLSGDRLRVGKAANATIRAAMPADPGLEALADLYEGAGPDRFAAIEAMDVYFTELELATAPVRSPRG